MKSLTFLSSSQLAGKVLRRLVRVSTGLAVFSSSEQTDEIFAFSTIYKVSVCEGPYTCCAYYDKQGQVVNNVLLYYKVMIQGNVTQIQRIHLFGRTIIINRRSH